MVDDIFFTCVYNYIIFFMFYVQAAASNDMVVNVKLPKGQVQRFEVSPTTTIGMIYLKLTS